MAKSTRRKVGWLTTNSASPQGHYVFHFSGFTRVSRNKRNSNGAPYSIVGLGHLVFLARGRVIGRQRSTVSAFSGAGPTQQSDVFDLAGTYSVRADHSGQMTLYFHKVLRPDTAKETIAKQPDMTDTFEFVCIDEAKRLRFVSTHSTMLPKKTAVDELISAEAIKA
jgi:hypothetical protein